MAAGVIAVVVALVVRGDDNGALTLQVVVSGRAVVHGEPGGHSCRARCRWSFDRGAAVRLRADADVGVRLLAWQGACSGRECAFRLERRSTVVARFDQRGSDRLQSWSAFTDCKPVKTTIGELVGARLGADGSPLESGGRFHPHLRGPAQQHLLRPPCFVRGTPTFVEIDGVAVSGPVLRAPDGDVVAHVLDTRSKTRNPYLRTLRVEIDATWLRAGVPLQDFPPQPATIDVQGFVYWNTRHGLGEPPEPSGWELHPVSSWLPAAG